MALEDTTVRLPTDRELPDSDGKPMDDERHGDQARIYLIEPLRRYLAEHGMSAFVGGMSFVYYDPAKKKAVGPDFYVVNGGVWRQQHKWVTWLEEWRLPTLIVEMLSPTTEREDRGRKFRLYRDVFRTPDYFLLDTDTGGVEAYHLKAGEYVRARTRRGLFPCQSLPLYLGMHDGWLRFFDKKGKLVPTAAEIAESEKTRAEMEKARADALGDEVRRLQEELRRLRGEA